MEISKGEKISIFIAISILLSAFYFYTVLPEEVASHWNAVGEIDGYTSRFWGAFLLPIINFLVIAAIYYFPRIDPKKENIIKFRKHFDLFVILIVCFFSYIYLLSIFINLGYDLNMIRFMAPAFAILFFNIGGLLSKTEPNWSIGIRTPWTLSSDIVWRKSHYVGAIIFKIIAGLILLGVFLPDLMIWLMLISLFAGIIFIYIYSYYLYKREIKK